MGLFSIFGSGLSALTSYSGAMSIVANNVANAGNESYSRQRVNYESLAPDVIGGIETGRGVQIANIEQIVNQNLEKRMTTTNYEIGRYQTQTEYLKNVEATMNEIQNSGGLTQAMADFFNGWTLLSTEADSTVKRQNIINNTNTLVSAFHTYANALNDSKNLVDSELRSSATEMNNILSEVADLNQAILESTENTGYNLRDNRRDALNRLAEYIDITYVDSTDGQFHVFSKSGQVLVSNNTASTVATTTNSSNGNHLDVTVTVAGTTTNVTSSLQGGHLKGLVDARDTYIDGYLDDLDDLAYTLASTVNTYHTAGYNLSGATSKKVFTTLSAVAASAANISISTDISTSPSAIAASSTSTGVPGNNVTALTISALSDLTNVTFQDTTTNSFTGYLGNTMSDVGLHTSLSEHNLEFKESILQQIKLDRQSESGVNVNDEQVDLLKLQSAYEAATRLVRVADDMITALLAMLVR